MSVETVSVMIDRIDEKVQTLELENQRLKQELRVLKQENKACRETAENLKQKLFLQEFADKGKIPETFDTWGVRITDKGYLELYKEFQSGMRTLHVGKTWDTEKARKKIAEAEDLPQMVYLSANLISGAIVPFCSRECCHNAGYAQKPENMWVDYDAAYPDQCAYCGKSFKR